MNELKNEHLIYNLLNKIFDTDDEINNENTEQFYNGLYFTYKPEKSPNVVLKKLKYRQTSKNYRQRVRIKKERLFNDVEKFKIMVFELREEIFEMETTIGELKRIYKIL